MSDVGIYFVLLVSKKFVFFFSKRESTPIYLKDEWLKQGKIAIHSISEKFDALVTIFARMSLQHYVSHCMLAMTYAQIIKLVIICSIRIAFISICTKIFAPIGLIDVFHLYKCPSCNSRVKAVSFCLIHFIHNGKVKNIIRFTTFNLSS